MEGGKWGCAGACVYAFVICGVICDQLRFVSDVDATVRFGVSERVFDIIVVDDFVIALTHCELDLLFDIIGRVGSLEAL